MPTMASLKKQLEKAKEHLEEVKRENAELEARGEASEIFKAIAPDASGDPFQRESSVFADPSWLQPTSDPPGLVPVGRESYVNALAMLLAPALKSGRGRNAFVVGAGRPALSGSVHG